MNRGEILKNAVLRSGIPISRLAKKLDVSRNTIYNWFERPDLDIDTMVMIGKVINYNFSEDLHSDLASMGIANEPDSGYGSESVSKCKAEREYYMKRCIDLLEQNLKLQEQLNELRNKKKK